jgi:uncharacterized protein YkwD
MNTRLFRAMMPLMLMLTIISCSPDTAEENVSVPTTTAAVVKEYNYNAEELELVNLINAHRQSLGLNTLNTINHISYKSEEHDEYMIANNVVNHDLFEERAQNIMAVLGAVKVNENIAYNYTTPESVLNAWLESPAHKANIEGDFTDFGISIRTDAETGKKYYTNIFIKK